MKKKMFKVKFLIQGEYSVLAENEEQARHIVLTDKPDGLIEITGVEDTGTIINIREEIKT